MNRDDERERELSAEDARLVRAIDARLAPGADEPGATCGLSRRDRGARRRGRASPWRLVAPACAAAAALVALWLVRPVEREVAPQSWSRVRSSTP